MDQDFDDVPQPRRPGRPKGSKNKPREKTNSVTQILRETPGGPRERAPSVAYEVYNTPDPLSMVQALYAEVAWRLDTLRNQRRVEKAANADRTTKGLSANELIVPILVDTANTLYKALVSHEKSLVLAEKLSKNKTPAELLEMSILKIMGQDLGTQQAIVRRLRENIARLAPENAVSKVKAGDGPIAKMNVADAFKQLNLEDGDEA